MGNITYGDKLYLKNFLKRIALILRNYDKLSLSNDLSGDLISLIYNISVNENLKKDKGFCQKISCIIKNILEKIKPNTLQIGVNLKIPMIADFSINTE
jgi:alpha-amylase/alpha-mannosidase (GH57 family)